MRTGLQFNCSCFRDYPGNQFVGFTQQEIAASDQPITVALVSTSQSLNDVGLLVTEVSAAKNITGSVTSVQAKDFNQASLPLRTSCCKTKFPVWKL